MFYVESPDGQPGAQAHVQGRSALLSVMIPVSEYMLGVAGKSHDFSVLLN